MSRSVFLPCCLGPATCGGAHQQDGLDGGPAHDVDQVVDGDLGVLDEVEHGQQELAVLGQDLGELPGIERAAAVGEGNDVVAFRHRWWLLCEGSKTPDDTSSSSTGAATDLSTFHYGRDIIVAGHDNNTARVSSGMHPSRRLSQSSLPRSTNRPTGHLVRPHPRPPRFWPWLQECLTRFVSTVRPAQ